MADQPCKDPKAAVVAEDELPDLGHPVNVFVDTSILESLNFAFNGRILKALLSSVDAGDIMLLMPEITRREVLSRIEKAVEAAKTAIGRFKKEAKVLRGLPEHSLATIFQEINWDEIYAGLERMWGKYIEATKATALPIDGKDAPVVFDDYFAEKAPFGSGDKKSEFPDAFVVRALRRFAGDNDCKVAVVSNDKDFEAACEEDESLVWFPELNKLLEHSARLRPFKPEEIQAMLMAHLPELQAAIANSFCDRGFYWQSDEGHDGDVEEVYDEEVKAIEVSVIDVEDVWAEISGEATVSFKARVSYPDPDMTYKDDESKKWISLGDVRATVSASEKLPVSFKVRVDRLREGALEYEDLVINDGADLWLSEDEVENVERPDYSR